MNKETIETLIKVILFESFEFGAKVMNSVGLRLFREVGSNDVLILTEDDHILAKIAPYSIT